MEFKEACALIGHRSESTDWSHPTPCLLSSPLLYGHHPSAKAKKKKKKSYTKQSSVVRLSAASLWKALTVCVPRGRGADRLEYDMEMLEIIMWALEHS